MSYFNALLTQPFPLHKLIPNNRHTLPLNVRQPRWRIPAGPIHPAASVLTVSQATTIYWGELLLEVRTDYSATIQREALNIVQRVQTGAIQPEAAAVVVHQSRNHNVLAMRELDSAPALLFATILKPVLLPISSFTRKYARSRYGREFPELQEEEKQNVSLLVLPLRL
jgi:hypothetical protein